MKALLRAVLVSTLLLQGAGASEVVLGPQKAQALLTRAGFAPGGSETAEFAGSWADALITVNAPTPHLHQMIEAFKRGGGEGKPLILQCHLSYAATDDEASASAFDQWRTTILPPIAGEGIRTPHQLEAAATFVRPEDMDGPVRISSDLGRHRSWIEEYLELGFERVYLHNVGRNQQEFIEAFGVRVLPEVSCR